jgi:tryptophanyl-tRNA synthetase
MSKKGRVFSGIRSTGKQHIGNYLGAMLNYVALQDDYDCIYSVVDVHSLTTLEDTVGLRDNVLATALDLLAAGIDPERSILYVQSHVPEVVELATLLGMITPLSWLTRVPTFKDKVRMHPENVNYGLVGYPVLQTADIVLYKADTVPVGEDQLPHLELAREIVRRFNRLFGETFPEPYAKLTEAPLILGLDGVNKMSKSLDNHIELAATPEDTERRVMTAVTDPQRTHRNIPGRPEVCNVYSLHAFFNAEKRPWVYEQCTTAGIGCVDCKKLLAEGINRALAPFRQRREELASRPEQVKEILADGAARAAVIARETLVEARENMGLPAPYGC